MSSSLRLVLAFLLTLFLQSCRAQELSSSLYCIRSITDIYSQIQFTDFPSPKSSHRITCPSKLQAISIYGAASRYCDQDSFDAGAQALSNACAAANKTIIGPSVFSKNYSSSIGTWPVLLQAPFGKYSKLNSSKPVLVEQPWFDVSYRSVSTWYYEVNNRKDYGWGAYGFWGAVLLAGMVVNVFQTFMPAKKASTDVEGARLKARSLSRIGNWFETYVTLSPVFGNHHRRLLLWCQVPTRLEAFIVYGYWLVSLALCCVSYETFDGNTYFPSPTLQGWRYVADRTGCLSIANITIIWLFAGRNNVFLWATGWSFTTFNLFHKHVARITTLEAIAHAAAYTYFYMQNNTYTQQWQQTWFILGAVAVVSMGFLVGTASVVLRAKSYEVFLVIHVVLSILVLYSLFQHVAVFDTYYFPYLWPAVAIWCLDRFLRIVRLITCNVGISRNGISFTKSELSYDADSDVLKITITPPPGSLLSLAKPSPGQYFYLYRPLSWKGWENHPFSLGAYSSNKRAPSISTTATEKTSRPQTGDDSLIKDVPIVQVTSQSTDNSRAASTTTPGQQRGQTLTYWIRPFNGWTRRLANNCIKQQNGEGSRWRQLCTSSIFLEGPYHNKHGDLIANNDRILMIAGGTGVAAIAPWVQEYLDRTAGVDNSAVRTKSVRMVWTNRGGVFMQDICNRELAGAVGRPDIVLDLYNTAAQDQTKSENLPAISHARPDISRIIKEEAELGDGRLTVLLCGPAAMADDARTAILQARKSGADVKYAEEVFGW